MIQQNSKTLFPIALTIAVLYAIVFLHATGRTHLSTDFARTSDPNALESDKLPNWVLPATSPPPVPDLAIATFLTGQATDDSYFIATRTLAYQLLHAPSTKLRNQSITFVALCSESLPENKRERLREDGATVIEVADVPIGSWVHTNVDRWKEQFTKLRVFEMTQYKRILYIDADTMIMKPMDDIFAEPEVTSLAPTLFSRKDQIKNDESELPKEWFFAARSDNAFSGERDHPVPPFQTLSLSAGFFMVAPDKMMFKHLESVIQHEGRFNPWSMEQSMLNYVFRRDGPMPWRELNWRWSATWPSEKDVEMGVHSLHEKFWVSGPQSLSDMWRSRKDEMLKYYENK
ncbi:nucleotide-diphospho-sugar transferase [Massarina eburnea CBS 473.64]|uniref:Nucleotide-diphospho-sugar transferase n=1 Tax=Massarina eburnea CBS 473.64 TaxID=1395130 RepID=A0A6A6RTV7_9PLEO|nr:nucleotide-diphospho-sugar transferase [Massarina eburnea CBS 473.64]